MNIQLRQGDVFVQAISSVPLGSVRKEVIGRLVLALGEQNAEVRRIMLERFGTARYIQESGSSLVHQDVFGKLYRRELTDDEPIVMVHVLNSTPEPDGSHTFSEASSIFGSELVNTVACKHFELSGESLPTNLNDLRFKSYWIRVPPTMQRAKEAVAWTMGLSEPEYQPAFES